MVYYQYLKFNSKGVDPMKTGNKSNKKKKYIKYKEFQGKYVYIVYRYDTDLPIYIGFSQNIKRRYNEHMRSKRGSGFAKKVPRHIRQRAYKFEVYDFSTYDQITVYDLRLLEALVTENMGAELSRAKKLSAKDRIRIDELKSITKGIDSKSYEAIVKEKL